MGVGGASMPAARCDSDRHDDDLVASVVVDHHHHHHDDDLVDLSENESK